MNKRIRIGILFAALALAVAGCAKIAAILAPAATWGTANFTTYVAMGTSITAGEQSDGTVVHHQTKAWPYLFAKAAGSPSFTIPSISPSGVPPLLRLLSFSPLVISRQGLTAGTNTNAAQATAYHNMGFSTALLADVADTSLYDAPGRDPMLRITQRYRGTILSQVASLAPTFVSFEYGANEILGAAGAGSGTALLSGAQFNGLLAATITGAKAAMPGAKFAIFNVPAIRDIPFFTTFPPVVIGADGNPVIPLIGLIGPSGQLAPTDLVLLTAGDSLAIGTGFPVGTFSYLTGAPGNGRPLLDSQVLSTAEQTSLGVTAAAYNTSIQTVADTLGAALVDLKGEFARIVANGFEFQGTTYTADFVTGGLFSLDGIHPNDLGHAILTNAFIDAVNRKFGASIPHVNLAESATATSSALRRSREETGRYPWIQHAHEMIDTYPPIIVR